MKKFRKLSEEVTPSSKPEPGREAVGGRFTSSAPKRPTKPAPQVTSEEIVSEIVMPQVKGDLGALDKTSFVKKHGISKSAARERVAEAKDEEEYGYEGDMAMNQLKTIVRHSEYLMDMLKPDTDLPEWVQSKITLAADYIQTSCDYMTSEMNEAKEMGDIPSGDASPANLTVKKGKTVASGTVTEATSAAVRMQRALQRAKEQREREERAGAALLNPKKPVKEDVMQEREDDEYHTPTKHHVQVQVSKGDGPKTHRKATVRAKEPQHAVSAAIAHYKQQGYTVHDHKYLGEDVERIEEGRPSQRHPLEGHEYHKKSDEALIHIAKDAHAAAEAMKGHNTTAENKYRDQANDSATVRHYRKTHGMQDWYKKKYGHMNEQKTSTEVPFDGPYTTRPSTVTDKSGAKHTPMSRARDLARKAAQRQARKMSVKESLEESRKAEIVKEIMKKGKNKVADDKFEPQPILGTTSVKADGS